MISLSLLAVSPIMESEHTRVPHYKAFISYSHADNSQHQEQQP